jgi:hypothetical protein
LHGLAAFLVEEAGCPLVDELAVVCDEYDCAHDAVVRDCLVDYGVDLLFECSRIRLGSRAAQRACQREGGDQCGPQSGHGLLRLSKDAAATIRQTINGSRSRNRAK